MCTPACACVYVYKLDFTLISDIGRYFTFCNFNVIYKCVWTNECVCVSVCVCVCVCVHACVRVCTELYFVLTPSLP